MTLSHHTRLWGVGPVSCVYTTGDYTDALMLSSWCNGAILNSLDGGHLRFKNFSCVVLPGFQFEGFQFEGFQFEVPVASSARAMV